MFTPHGKTPLIRGSDFYVKTTDGNMPFLIDERNYRNIIPPNFAVNNILDFLSTSIGQISFLS